ncbi:Holliday junction resolvase RuvX [Variovorax sp. PCZ-1]|uniref:Holliday junction resolvase RuvX n=1 Tax=Variovorax sp. PCZ-1 TaxID=2835533 RepID=UPI001BCD5497|nr:Holliday junction resolvase RuvX [Variovorax sp. PCZ-1]MBS7808079.1 Holliday junction resolvase RuvX [Variovorax sp. PCZ-1]
MIVAGRLARSIPPQQQSFLSFDFGVKRTGVASGTRLTATATPMQTIHTAVMDERFTAIEKILREWQPDALVVGIPTHPDGAAHEMTQRAQRFARQLHGRFNLPVHEVDERYSSVEAESRGAKDIDAEAAAIILEQFFSEIEE